MKIRRRKAVTLITDASYCHLTGVYGWAFYITFEKSTINIYRSGAGLECDSSMTAELIAVRKGLEYLAARRGLLYQRRFTIMTDCRNIIDKIDRKAIYALEVSNLHIRHIPAHQTRKKLAKHECFRLHDWCDSTARKKMRDFREEHYEYLELKRQAREIEHRMDYDPRDPDFPDDDELIKLHFLYEKMAELI